MKIIIIGSVAAGTSVAAKARRNSEENEIVIYEKDTDISYSVCGIPYYLGEEYISRDNLTPRNEAWFKKRFNIDIKTSCEVFEINPETKKIKIKNLIDNTEFEDYYDKLVLTTGSENIIPNIEGIDSENVFFVKNIHSADKIKNYINQNNVKKALVIGSGFIGLEILDNLKKLNLELTLIEKESHLMPHLDGDMSTYLEKYMKKENINFILNQKIIKIDKNTAYLENGEKLKADLFIFATGIKPNIKLAENIGIKLGKFNGILVNEKMETSIKDIYSAGDCCEHLSLINNENIYRPLGSTANKMGRIAGDVITGGNLEFRGILGTGILKFMNLSIGYTGMTEKEALKNGYEIEKVHNIKENQTKYLKESKEMTIKAIADKKTGKLLGVQIIGENGVDKRIDVFATAMTFGAKVSDLFHLDLAYAPPFSTTKDPVMYTGMILDNAINHNRKILTVNELIQNRDKFKVIDVRSEKDYEKGHIENAVNIPIAKLREKSKEYSKDDFIVVHCNKGVTGNAGQNILINLGFENVYNLSGGYKNYSINK